MASTTRRGTTDTITRSPTLPTHAGGIQPSASFFHPSKPNQRHRSPSADNDGGIYNLSSLSKQISNSEDDHLPRFSAEDAPTKQGSGSGRRGALSPSRMVRNSVELVFSLRRGMSLEALPPKSPSSGGRAEEQGTRRKISGQGDYPSGSPASSFVLVGTPAPAAAPRSAVPLLDPATKKPLRNYELHLSRNRFLLRGRLLIGGDSPWAFIASFSLLLGITGVWLGTTAVWWWRNISPAVVIVGAYLALIAISTMLATAMRDPGILPRDLDTEPPYPATSPVRVKWCTTCATYRPPRASHCRMCDNCVDGLDHHCRWVNNCVGRRNYTTFFVLLSSLMATALYVIVTAALHLSFLARWPTVDGGDGSGGFKHA
ncbi:DHHC palmitoyltransferase-domain-containing protein, partial [Mycena metata]